MLISHYIHYFVYFLLFLVLSLLNSITNKKYLLVFESSCVFAYMHTYTYACLQRDVWSFSWNDVGRTKSKRVHHVAFNIYQLTHASQIHKTRKYICIEFLLFAYFGFNCIFYIVPKFLLSVVYSILRNVSI